MSYWNAKYPNDHGEYEITFGSKIRETTKAVEKVCTAVMDGLVKSPEDIKIVIPAHWVIERWNSGWIKRCTCSNCGNHPRDAYDPPKYCDNCGAHMDEEVTE